MIIITYAAQKCHFNRRRQINGFLCSERCEMFSSIQTQSLQNSIPSYLYGVAPNGGSPASPCRLGTLPACHQEELSQPLLHQAGKTLVVCLQGGAVYILDHCKVRRQRTEEGFRG